MISRTEEYGDLGDPVSRRLLLQRRRRLCIRRGVEGRGDLGSGTFTLQGDDVGGQRSQPGGSSVTAGIIYDWKTTSETGTMRLLFSALSLVNGEIWMDNFGLLRRRRRYPGYPLKSV